MPSLASDSSEHDEARALVNGDGTVSGQLAKVLRLLKNRALDAGQRKLLEKYRDALMKDLELLRRERLQARIRQDAETLALVAKALGNDKHPGLRYLDLGGIGIEL